MHPWNLLSSDEKRLWLQFENQAEEFELMTHKIMVAKMVGSVGRSYLERVDPSVYG